jgi:hypothetical protein
MCIPPRVRCTASASCRCGGVRRRRSICEGGRRSPLAPCDLRTLCYQHSHQRRAEPSSCHRDKVFWTFQQGVVARKRRCGCWMGDAHEQGGARSRDRLAPARRPCVCAHTRLCQGSLSLFAQCKGNGLIKGTGLQRLRRGERSRSRLGGWPTSGLRRRFWTLQGNRTNGIGSDGGVSC